VREPAQQHCPYTEAKQNSLKYIGTVAIHSLKYYFKDPLYYLLTFIKNCKFYLK